MSVAESCNLSQMKESTIGPLIPALSTKPEISQWFTFGYLVIPAAPLPTLMYCRQYLMSERNKFGDIFLETPNYLSLKSLNLKTSAIENYNSAIIYCGANFHINKIAKCLLIPS